MKQFLLVLFLFYLSVKVARATFIVAGGNLQPLPLNDSPAITFLNLMRKQNPDAF